jgi:syntaxin 5
VVKKKPEIPASRNAFNEAASDIAKGVHKASQQLSKLAKLVKSQGLFDDATEEINNLICRIKEDLDQLNNKCDSAQQYVDGKKRSLGDKNQLASHNSNVVGQLKSELMHTTKDFKTVLELRSSKMKDQQQRKVAIAGNGILSPMRQFNANTKIKSSSASAASSQQYNSSSYSMTQGSPYASSSAAAMSSIYQQKSHAGDEEDMPDPYSPSSSSSSSSVSIELEQQQLLLAPPATLQYYESREQAVNEVEKTIGELGQLFKRLATMISQQQELVERIDEDIESSVSSAERAHNILLKTYEKVASNRGLYMKIFAVFAIFILFFLLFLM